MNRSDIDPMPEYFDRYITLVAPDHSLSQALNDSLESLQNLNLSALERLGNLTYAARKWAVNDIFQHLIDIERIWCYRVLLIARNDTDVSPTVDSDAMAVSANASMRPVGELIDELIAVRIATIKLFMSFDDNELRKTGINWKYESSVLAFGFCVAGHQIWHLNIIKERYLPLLG